MRSTTRIEIKFIELTMNLDDMKGYNPTLHIPMFET